MKLSILIDSILIVAAVALLPGITGAQRATNSNGSPLVFNSNNLPSHSSSGTLNLSMLLSSLSR
jgi:hypothetical protein